MANTNNLKWEDMELLKELGNITRFQTPVPSKAEVETSNLNKNMFYEIENNEIVSIAIVIIGLSELPEYIGNSFIFHTNNF